MGDEQLAEQKQSATWHDYQETVAELFRRIGFEASVDETIQGVRGKHQVDVLVRPKLAGVSLLWVVECKYWSTRVPKAQVLTLVHIAQDVGADRAFLFSEQGFQAGAISSAAHTNVTLVNLDEIESAAASSIAEAGIRRSFARIKEIESVLRDLLDRQKFQVPPMPLLDRILDLLGVCLDATLATSAALAQRYPVRLMDASEANGLLVLNDPGALAEALQRTLERLERAYAAIEVEADAVDEQVRDASQQLVHRVQSLFVCCEVLLDADADAEKLMLRRALEAMRAVGQQAEELRTAHSHLHSSVSAVMHELIDGVYLWLGDPNRPLASWPDLRGRVESKLTALEKRSRR